MNDEIRGLHMINKSHLHLLCRSAQRRMSCRGEQDQGFWHTVKWALYNSSTC